MKNASSMWSVFFVLQYMVKPGFLKGSNPHDLRFSSQYQLRRII